MDCKLFSNEDEDIGRFSHLNYCTFKRLKYRHFRQPEDTKNPYFILYRKKSRKKLLALGLTKSCYIITSCKWLFVQICL